MTTFLWIELAAAGIMLALIWLAFQHRERAEVDSLRDKAPGRFVRLSDGVTHVLDLGPRDGEVVLLVPGATLGLWVWHDLPLTLSNAGYRVIAFDLYGRGLSDRPYTTYNADLFDRQIVDLLQELRVPQPVSLVGLAFGCPISANFVLRHPDAVKRVCFFGPDGFGVVMTGMAKLVQRRLIGDFLFRLIGNKALIARLPGYSTNKKVLTWLEANYTPDLDLKGFKRALLSSIRNMPIHDARDLYARVDQTGKPFMFIWGREDHVTPIPPRFDPAAIFPRANMHLLPRVGHLPHVDAPEATNERLLAFLRDDKAPVAFAAK
ncbi:MAG: alpha/beta fold hydrolase [Parvibaculum sp.]|nr:alpha/beta fold hydrolase [Parvibaculum sp.]